MLEKYEKIPIDFPRRVSWNFENPPLYSMLNTSYKGEKQKIQYSFYVNHDFGLKISGKFLNTTRNCVERFRTYTNVFLARYPPKQVP